MALRPGTETIRFRQPTGAGNAVAVKKEEVYDEFGNVTPIGWKRRHQGLLQDKVRRQQNGPIVPSLSLAIRLLLLMRTTGAMYAIIADCDEVFNFWEPLHYFTYNSGFQTWELSPQFAIRSWAYVILHWPLAHIGPKLIGMGKRQAFFTLRIALGAICSFCEAKFYRAVVDSVNERVGRYLLCAMMLSAGMWSASISFLPSSFSMYATLLACSYSFHPATSTPTGIKRAYRGTLAIAAGAIIGWPFAAALGVPFLFEQLFLTGGEVIVGEARKAWQQGRWQRMGKAIGVGALIAIPISIVDSWAYGKSTFPTLNILSYNLFSSSGGPDLYGSEPFSFYFVNLFLNFNFLLLLALASLPALAITFVYDKRRLGKTQQSPKEGETSPYTLMIVRLLPFYIWLTILSLQSHKEERFFYPAYPLLCFNAATTLYLVKGWMETYFIYRTNSPYRASKTGAFSWFTLTVILVPGIISIGRVFALGKFYHAPFDIVHHFEYHTIPSILTELGYSPLPPPKDFVPKQGEVIVPEWDYTPLETLEPRITLCYGAEWFRFPGSYLIPDGIDVHWIESDMKGMMPRKWEKSAPSKRGSWPREETRVVREGRFNGENKPSSEAGTYIPVEDCNYLVSLYLPSKQLTALEPDFASQPEWTPEYCTSFLDARSSKWWSRIIYLPFGLLDEGRVKGEYCLLRRNDTAVNEEV
ncbi:hypothetical protein P7C73_g729, partial [Tremellales sp. Uapishka_1]